MSALLFGLIFTSCNPVKFVPEDKYLVSNVQVNVDNERINKESARALIKQKENYKILGFLKFHLMLYNLSPKNKEEGWLKRIGEPPQIYNEDLKLKSEEQLLQYAYSKGFFKASVTGELKKRENKRKIEIVYNLKTGDQYQIKQINYQIKDSALKNLYFNSPVKNELKPGDAFDIEKLEKHQLNIVKLFRNNGYYYLSKDDVKFLADSSIHNQQVKVDLLIRPAANTQIDSSKVFKQYYLNKFYISVLPGNAPVTINRDSTSVFSDTLKWGNST